jgi:succinyl-diaminopimelate desuccinylase
MLAAIQRHIDASAQFVIDLQRSLVAIPALGPMNGGPGEKDKTEFLKPFSPTWGSPKYGSCAPGPRRAVRLPAQHRRCRPRPQQRQDLLGHLPHRHRPSGDLALWDSDPYALKVDGDIIIGRGVEDNHQGIVSSLVVAKALLDLKLTPEINYGVLLVADEETGSKYGLDHVVKHHPELFGPDDLFLVPDFGEPGSEMIEIAEKSMLWLKIVVEGKQCHASTPSAGVNSLLAAAAFITRVPSLHQRFDRKDPLFDPDHSTFQPTKKEANVENVNTIPGRDVFYLDCRVMPGYDLDEIMTAIREIGDVSNANTASASATNTCNANKPPRQPRRRAKSCASSLPRCGRSTATIPGCRASERHSGRVSASRRHKAAVWSTLMHNAHQPNERSSISCTLKDAKVMAAVLADI